MTKPPINLPSLISDDERDGIDEPTGTETRAQPSPISMRSNQRARFTVMTGVSAGLVVTLEKDVTVIGRAPDVDIRFDEAGISRHHARVTRTRRGRHLLEDLGSKNGTLLNGGRVTRHELLEVGDRLQVGSVIVVQFGLFDDAEDELARRLYEASTRDTLTKSYNRRYLLERFDAEFSYARRHQSELGVILFDLDFFKKVNDTYGHPAGDRVLSAVSARVLKLIRKEDTFARYGGEEFAVLVRGLSHENVMRFAERVRKAIEALRVPPHDEATVAIETTISLGVATLAECVESASPGSLLALADKRLYRAKDSGRNRTCGI